MTVIESLWILHMISGCEHTSTLFDAYNGFTMPWYLQGALDSKMPKMTFEELGFVAHAIHKAHFHLRTPNKSITSFLAKVHPKKIYTYFDSKLERPPFNRITDNIKRRLL